MQAMMKAGFKYHGHSAELRLFNLDLQNNERLKICSAYILQWEASNKSQELGFTRVHIDEYFEGQSALEEFNSALLSLKKIHDRIGRENFVIQTPKNKKTLAAIQAIVEKNRSLNLGDVMTSEYFKSYLGLSHGIYHEFFEAIGGKARNKFNRFIAAKIGREHDRRHESEQTSKPGFEGIESRFTASTIKSRLAGGHETYKRLSKSVGESGLLGKKNEFISFLAEKRNTNLIHSANSDGLPLGRRSA